MLMNIGTRELKSYRKIKFQSWGNKLDRIIVLFIEFMVARDNVFSIIFVPNQLRYVLKSN